MHLLLAVVQLPGAISLVVKMNPMLIAVLSSPYPATTTTRRNPHGVSHLLKQL